MSSREAKPETSTDIHPDWRHQLEENGYIVVPNVLPQANLEAVIADIWHHANARPDDRETWYQPDIIRSVGMVEMYHYQSMWDNRQHPRLYELFCSIFGTEKLWVSIDRVALKPPVDPRYPIYDHKGFIHWDTDIARYPNIPFGVQGVLALEDTDADMGGFQCIPELYHELAQWFARQPKDTPISRNPDTTGYQLTKVPLHAGDMVIWSTLMPHGNGHNTSDRPRLAQYITMFPAQEDNEQVRETRINSWHKNTPLPYSFFPGDPRKIEEKRPEPAQLTALGRKLLGLDRWE